MSLPSVWRALGGACRCHPQLNLRRPHYVATVTPCGSCLSLALLQQLSLRTHSITSVRCTRFRCIAQNERFPSLGGRNSPGRSSLSRWSRLRLRRHIGRADAAPCHLDCLLLAALSALAPYAGAAGPVCAAPAMPHRPLRSRPDRTPRGPSRYHPDARLGATWSAWMPQITRGPRFSISALPSM